MAVFSRNRNRNKNKKQDKPRKNPVLKIVHPMPRGYIEMFRDPIPAWEIMRRYPRYGIARPDVFEFPWIVVHPESVLVPGKVFFLVPYTTLDKLLKAKRNQLECLNLSSRLSHFRSPIKALEWVNLPSHKPKDRNYMRQSEEQCGQESTNCNNTLQEKDLDNGYRESFYKTWNEMRRNLQSESDDHTSFDHLILGFNSPFFDSGRYDTSPEPVNFKSLKSCLRKPDSERKRLNLRVRFAVSVVITGGQRGSPSHHNDDMV